MFSVKLSCLCLGALALALLLVACKSESDRTPFPATTPFPPEEAARLRVIRDGVASLRRLSVGPEIQEGVVSRDALKAYLQESFEEFQAEERRQLETFNLAFRVMRLIDADDDLLTAVRSGYGEGIVGLYVPREDRLVLVDDARDGGAKQEIVLAHEWVHALQDHAFDLEAFEKRGENDRVTELGRTLSCVFEGDATVTSHVFMVQAYGPSWASQLDNSDPTSEDEVEVPEAIKRYMSFDYRECVSFITAVLLFKGWDGVNKLYELPPVSTEQILHPNKFFNNETPQNLIAGDLRESLGSGWKRHESSVFGEFDVYNYLLAGKGPEAAAASAAQGWGGGRLNLYSQKSKKAQNVVVHIALAWDSYAELDEFRHQYDVLLTSLAYEARSQNEDGALWQWMSAGEYGYALWKDGEQRVDLLLGTDGASLERAKGAILSSGSE
jgi:hypothetical protein